MAGEPKRRHSRQRKGKRRASISLSIPNAIVCPNCGNMNLAHSICSNCGFYRGKEYISKSSNKSESSSQ